MTTSFKPPFEKARAVYQEYPSQYWLLIGASFIDSLGGFLLFPFFALYITAKFGVGMTQVGMIFGGYSIASVAGSAMGGALTDRFGRKGMVIFGLVASATSSLVMGLVNRIELFIAAALFVGLFAEAGGPARQAMIADVLPEEKRAEGFGLFRVAFNLAAVIGPAAGGLLAARSYLSLFVIDAGTSLVTAAILVALMAETKPQPTEAALQESAWAIFRGYGRILHDAAFMLFLLASTFMVLVYFQMNSTLAVYLRDVHAVTERWFGYILSLNAAMVVLFQFPITRRIEGYPRFLVLAVGTLLNAIGFAIYGFVSAYPLFLLAMVVITSGEMLTAPVLQAVVAQMAPEDMRGRYMAVYGFTWILPAAVGTFLAGLIMDNFDPRWVWYAAGLVGMVPVLIFLTLHRRQEAAPENQAQVAATRALAGGSPQASCDSLSNRAAGTPTPRGSREGVS